MDNDVKEVLRTMKKVELHRHLEGSVRLATLREAIVNTGKYADASPEELSAVVDGTFRMLEPVTNLSVCMERFMATQALFANYDFIERVAFEVCEDAYTLDNTVVLELRYSPDFVMIGHPDLTRQAVHDAVVRGVTRAMANYPMAVGLIGIVDRLWEVAEAHSIMDFFIANKDTFIAVDLANDELKFNHKDAEFAALFQNAASAGLHVTIHAGEIPETSSPRTVAHAISQMGAERIGHGIHVMGGKTATQLALSKKTHFEVCPTSNYLTNACRTLEEHPLRSMIDAGLSISLSTDDPGVFGLTLTGEYTVAMEKCGVTLDEIKNMVQEAYERSFIPLAARERVWA